MSSTLSQNNGGQNSVFQGPAAQSYRVCALSVTLAAHPAFLWPVLFLTALSFLFRTQPLPCVARPVKELWPPGVRQLLHSLESRKLRGGYVTEWPGEAGLWDSWNVGTMVLSLASGMWAGSSWLLSRAHSRQACAVGSREKRWKISFLADTEIQGPAQRTPFSYYKIFYCKIISMWFCNITISHSSIPYDILGETFKLKL